MATTSRRHYDHHAPHDFCPRRLVLTITPTSAMHGLLASSVSPQVYPAHRLYLVSSNAGANCDVLESEDGMYLDGIHPNC
jgi:hypothetical protein